MDKCAGGICPIKVTLSAIYPKTHDAFPGGAAVTVTGNLQRIKLLDLLVGETCFCMMQSGTDCSKSAQCLEIKVRGEDRDRLADTCHFSPGAATKHGCLSRVMPV